MHEVFNRTFRYGLLSLIITLLSHCANEAHATITVNSLTPPENSNINNKSTINFDLDYSIENYDSSIQYELSIGLHHSKKEIYINVYSIDISGPEGNVNESFSGKNFYDCYTIIIDICSRKAPLPFQFHFRIKEKEDSTNIGRSRAYTYDEL